MNNGGKKGKDHQGICIKDPWTKPNTGRIEDGRWGWVGQGRLVGVEMETTVLWGGSTRRTPWPPQMRISLPRHDLLGEERWLISQRRRAKSLFLNGLLLGSISQEYK